MTTLLTARWHALRVASDGDRLTVDTLIRDELAPLADAAVADGRLRRWFFLRYSEGGEHLRWRLETERPEVVDELAEQVRSRTGRDVATACYEPEVERYGGPGLIDVAEQLFCDASRLAVELLRSVPADGRAGLALELIVATARGLGLTATDAAAWLRMSAASWRWQLAETDGLRSVGLHAAAVAAAPARAAAVWRRWSGDPQPVWRGLVAARTTSDRPRALGIAASQLHLMLNRLGITPDEERWLQWLAAACLEFGGAAPDPQQFFSTAPDAPDRAYLAASRYALAEMPVQAPEDRPVPEALFDWAPPAPAVDLPASPLPPMSLTTALQRRRSVRGPYGPLTAAGLGTLLWTALRSEDGLTGRAYPSAGGQLPVRLRVIAGDVEGVPRGLYEADPGARRLLRVGPCPGAAELAEASMWLHDGPAAPELQRVDAAALPALLGVYVDLRPVRSRYGLRALRFALLEAGHVTQNLALVAAAAGVNLTPLGGFYDEIAHELMMLDGVDRALTYLVPVGGSVATSATPRMYPATPARDSEPNPKDRSSQ